jgi:hypothetical protein
VTLDVEEVRRRVMTCGDVFDVVGGPGGVGTPVPPGRYVEGVRDLDPGVEVHVKARWGFTVDRLTAQVYDVLGALCRPVHVVIDDVQTPLDHAADATPQTGPAPSALGEPERPDRDLPAAAGLRPDRRPALDATVVVPTAEVDALVVVVEVDQPDPDDGRL